MPKPEQSGGLAVSMAGSIAGSTRQPSSKLKNQRVVRIISICSHFLPTLCKDMWEAKLHGVLKIKPDLAITVDFHTRAELSGFHSRLIIVCRRGRAAAPCSASTCCHRRNNEIRIPFLVGCSEKSSLLSGDNPSLFTGNHRGLCQEVLFW